MKESALERIVANYCKHRKLKCFKWASPGNRGVMDRIIFGPGKIMFLELKREGKKPTKLQEYVSWDLAKTLGDVDNVYIGWTDNWDEAKSIIDEFFHE